MFVIENLSDVAYRRRIVGLVNVLRMNERAPLSLVGKRLFLPHILIVSSGSAYRVAVNIGSSRGVDHRQFNSLSVPEAVSPVVRSRIKRTEIERVGKGLSQPVRVYLCIIEFFHVLFSPF